MERYNFINLLFLFKIEFMIRRFLIILCCAFLTTCDDGDILTIDLDFDGVLSRCDNFEDSHLVYDTRSDPDEALLLIFPRSEINDALFAEATTVDVATVLTINGSAIRFIYRTYNRSLSATDICAVVPPSDLTIRENYEAPSGKVFITSTILDDDGDGIPSALEYGPGGLADPQDSDGDGLFDYQDKDDDNDNVLTIDEIDTENLDGDDDPTTNPLNTDANFPDGDTQPDYLDDDDDGDGVPTYLEDVNGDKNPRGGIIDQVVDGNGIDIFRYLYNDPSAMEAFPDSGKRVTKYARVVTTTFRIEDFDLEILRSEVIDFGTLTTNLELSLD